MYYLLLLYALGISGLGEDDIQVNKMLCQTQFYTLLQTQLDTMLQTLLQTKLGTQLMPIKKALDYVVLDALDHWEKMHTETDSVVHSTNENNLAVSSFYGTNQSHYCMMLGDVRNTHIFCTHIWPNFTD